MMKIPDGHGICPVCNGTAEVPLTTDESKYSWNKGKTHRPCSNCGGQTMSGKATGTTLLNKEGVPCRHEYTSRTLGRCYTGYTCKHCGLHFAIDSGD
jgi:hypothetical protein